MLFKAAVQLLILYINNHRRRVSDDRFFFSELLGESELKRTKFQWLSNLLEKSTLGQKLGNPRFAGISCKIYISVRIFL